MSKTGTRDNNIISKDKVPVFLTLMDLLSKRCGGWGIACKKYDLSPGQWTRAKNGEGNISITFAKKILAAHKSK